MSEKQTKFIEGRDRTLYRVVRDDGCCVLQVAIHDDLDCIGIRVHFCSVTADELQEQLKANAAKPSQQPGH